MAFGKLEIKLADGSTTTIELTKRQMILGRASDADVVVNDNLVSRRHVVLLCGPEGVQVVDAGSANGTFLGGQRLPAQQPIPLMDGAQFRVGQTLLTFRAAKVEAEVAAVAAAEAQPSQTEPQPEATQPRDQETMIKALSSAAADVTRPPPTFGPPPPAAPEKPESASRPSRPPPGVPTHLSTYLKYLPAIYSADEFLGRFLLIFESILGPLERTVDNLHYYFDARLTPPDLLPWLASWLGLVLDERWPEAQRRELIRSAVDLYQWRGTRRGLAEFIRLYTGFTPEIAEPAGKKKAAAEEAFRFSVKIKVPNPAQINPAVVHSIIETEKPAHAGYSLEIVGA